MRFCHRESETCTRNIVVDLDETFASLDLNDEKVISDIYLGELVYEMLGMQGSDPYFDFLCVARRSLPVICKHCYLTSDGEYTMELDADRSEIVNKLYHWRYYRLKSESVD